MISNGAEGMPCTSDSSLSPHRLLRTRASHSCPSSWTYQPPWGYPFLLMGYFSLQTPIGIQEVSFIHSQKLGLLKKAQQFVLLQLKESQVAYVFFQVYSILQVVVSSWNHMFHLLLHWIIGDPHMVQFECISQHFNKYLEPHFNIYFLKVNPPKTRPNFQSK